jgi:hypothetical protein
MTEGQRYKEGSEKLIDKFPTLSKQGVVAWRQGLTPSSSRVLAGFFLGHIRPRRTSSPGSRKQFHINYQTGESLLLIGARYRHSSTLSAPLTRPRIGFWKFQAESWRLPRHPLGPCRLTRQPLRLRRRTSKLHWTSHTRRLPTASPIPKSPLTCFPLD